MYYNRGQMYVNKKDYNKAIRYFKVALLIRPHSAKAAEAIELVKKEREY